jgi:YgiT-type zinc finger domain-containing protein
MKCVICKTGETKPGSATVTLQRGETTVLIKETPADVCQNCGEYYLNETVAGKVYAQAEEAVQRHAEVEILHYAA